MPYLPPQIIPKEGQINDKHLEKYYKWFPALDPDYDRSQGWESSLPMGDATKMEFQEALKHCSVNVLLKESALLEIITPKVLRRLVYIAMEIKLLA